ncbi:MAG: FtsX-like permease family protein [Luteitalea sp.]|nr:FtsX-like permease family protein [Luteitalea sp.]
MGEKPAWRRYARFFGADVASDVDEELRFHLDEKTRDLIDSGLTPEAARAEALRQFGEVAEMGRLCQALGQSRERTIERRHAWTGWGRDLQYAVRTLRKAPIVTAVAVLSIALGIGANTAVFTLLDQVLLRKLPVDAPDRIVRVHGEGYYYGSTMGSGRELSYPLYLDFRNHNQVFSGIFGLCPFNAAVSAGERAEMTPGELVTGTYFSTLGVGAIRGRVIGPDDDRVPGGHAVVVISHAYWQRRFGADPYIVGRTLTISNHPMTIIGVVEPGFNGMNIAAGTQVFVPVTMTAEMFADVGPSRLEDRGLRWLNVFARLKRGVTPEQARASLAPFYRSILQTEVNDERFARATDTTKRRFVNDNHIAVTLSPGGHTPVRREMQRPLWILMAIVCGVLLIACANVANLLLARGASRQREVAIRLSLGATRGCIVRQLLVESLMLAIAGGLAGLLLATVGVQLAIGFFVNPESVTLIKASPDLRVLSFTGTVTVLTGLLFGLVPAFQATTPALAPTLKDQAGSVLGGGHVRLRKALVASQVALSLLLLIGAGLFIRSLNGLMTLDLGFETGRLLTFGANPRLAGYEDTRVKHYAIELLAKVRATPGVSAAGFAQVALLRNGWWGSSIAVEGYQATEDQGIGSRCNAVSPGYFEAMGIPLLMGRDFNEGDFRVAEPAGETAEQEEYRVVIASESFVKQYIQGNPIGRHIGFGADPGTPTPIEIVGVVKDSTYASPAEERQGQLYFPFLESRHPRTAWFYVRTAQDPGSMLAAMRRVMQEIDPNVPPLAMRTVDNDLKRSLVNQRLVTGLSTVFGLSATLLAVVGLYGVMAYSVTRRTREIGIRMARGARATRAAWLIMREAMMLVAIGVGVALPAVWWLSRYVQSELYGVAPTDPMAIGVAVLGLTVVAAAAGLIPALRAARINPIRALRHE